MPIKPENKKLYPKNWKEIRQQILERAGHKCEFCGVENHVIGFRLPGGGFVKCANDKTVEFLKKYPMGTKLIRIVLTIAHLDHDPTNNNPSNLRALCQRCHLHYDKEHHAETRKKTQELKKEVLDENI